MSLRSKIVSKLLTDRSSRESYLRAKLNQIIPSQIKALRLKMPWTQKELGCEAEMKQARISAMEKPGEVAFTLETLIRLASAFRVGLKIEFVPFSEMVKWDDGYNQDAFSVTPIEKDEEFLNPSAPAPFTVTTSFYPFNPTPSGAWSTIAVNGIYMDVDGAGHSDFPLYTPFSTGIPVAFHSIAGNRDKELAA